MTFLDSISAALKGGKDSRVRLAAHGFEPWATALPYSGHDADYNYDRAIRDGFLSNPIAQRAVKIVTDGISQVPLQADNAQLLDLIQTTPDGANCLESLATHLILHGNAYAQIIKDGGGHPVELFALRPDRVRIIAGVDGWPSAYEYRAAGATTTIPLEDRDGWPNIIHVAAPHPLDDHYGASSLRAAWQAITIHNAASRWNRVLLENAARPSGALVHEGTDGASLTNEQFERLSSELREAYSGSINAGRPMLLDGGLKWQSLALSPADMDFATLKSAAARDIALAFGVPPMLLGLPGDNTYANYREANRALWRLTLLPLAQRLAVALQHGLRPWFANSRLEVDLDQIPALSEERERLWQQVSQATFLSDKEKRTMLGIQPNDSKAQQP